MVLCYYPLLLGGGVHALGCQSSPGLPALACFQGESSLGSLFILILFFALNAGASSDSPDSFCGASAPGVTSERISCFGLSSSSFLASTLRASPSLDLNSASAFVCTTPDLGSLDSSICIGCCLFGASNVLGFAAHRSSARAASSLILACLCTSACCSCRVGGSNRVWRNHCIHPGEMFTSP